MFHTLFSRLLNYRMNSGRLGQGFQKKKVSFANVIFLGEGGSHYTYLSQSPCFLLISQVINSLKSFTDLQVKVNLLTVPFSVNGEKKSYFENLTDKIQTF